MRRLPSTLLATAVALAAGAAPAHAQLQFFGPLMQSPTTGHWYAVTNDSWDWNAADSKAKNAGGYLVSIGSTDEEAFLRTTFGSTENFYIGLFRTEPHGTTFAWTNGEPVTYTNWAPGEPNDAAAGEGERGTLLNWNPTTGAWNDKFWQEQYRGLAEFDADPTVVVTPTATPEPATVGLLATGLAGIGVVARRRRKA